MITSWASQYRCDRCRKEGPVLPAEMSPPGSPDGAGWTHLAGIGITRSDGFILRDFCPECAALPFEQIVRVP